MSLCVCVLELAGIETIKMSGVWNIHYLPLCLTQLGGESEYASVLKMCSAHT